MRSCSSRTGRGKTPGHFAPWQGHRRHTRARVQNPAWWRWTIPTAARQVLPYYLSRRTAGGGCPSAVAKQIAEDVRALRSDEDGRPIALDWLEHGAKRASLPLAPGRWRRRPAAGNLDDETGTPTPTTRQTASIVRHMTGAAR